jgi:hypothetical protein
VDLGSVKDAGARLESGTTGRRTVAAGLAVITAYLGLAVVSGHLSPLARGPLLDGIGPAQPYRWVCPPPELASTNRKPSGGTLPPLQLGSGGAIGQALLTTDDQVTLVVPDGAIRAHGGDRQVTFVITPVCPTSLGAPGQGLVSFGNAYRLSATYEPSGVMVRSIKTPLQAILLYPVTVNLRSTSHSLYVSTDGTSWTKRQSTDDHAMQQVIAKIPALGYVQVAGVPGAASVTPAPTGISGGTQTLKVALLVLGACVLLIGVGLLLRSRG